MAVLVVLVAGGCRAEDPAPAPAVESPDPGPAGVKVAPRWEAVARFAGRGRERTGGFEIGAGAIQWRAKVSCTEARCG